MKTYSPAPMSDGKTDGKNQQSNSLTLALIYAAFAGMWILFSDQVLVWLFSDPADYAMASTFKGLFFVVVTSLLLYGLMRRLEGGTHAPPLGKGLGWPSLLMAVLVVGLTSVVINHSLARGEGLAVAAWIGMAGLLALIVLGAAMLILYQRAQLQLAQDTRIAQDERLRALKLLAAIADSSEDAIFALDLEGRFVMANRVVLADTGTTLDELLGKDESSLFPPEVAAAVMDDNRWVLAHGVSRTVEETLPLAGGKQTLLTTKSPLRDESGKIIGLLGIGRDITERKAAEDALRASELRFHDIVNVSADWIWEIDALARFTYASESVLDMLGYTPAEILGKTPFDLMPPAEAARLRGEFADIAARRAPFRDLDNINLHKDGSLRHVSTNGMPMLDANGVLIGYRGLDRDITDKRLAQLELEATGNRLRTLINTLPDLVWLKDPDGVYLACNPRFEALYGAREADIIGKTDHDFVAAELADFFRAHDQAAIDAGGPRINEEEVTFASDGHRELLHTIKTPVHDNAGRVIGVLGIARDITALKAATQALQARERYIRALFDTFPFMVWLKDRDSRFLAANKVVARIANVADPNQMVGKSDLDYWEPTLAEHYRADDRAVLESGQPKTLEEEITEPGRRFWIETYKSPVELDGQVIGTVGYARDISERKQAEVALLRLTDDLAATLRAIPDLLFELDEAGRYLKVEATAHHLLAAPAEQLLGHTVNDMLPPDAAATIMAALADAARNGTDYGKTISLPLPGEIRHFELSVSRKTMAASETPHFIVLSRDISARQAAEEELRRNNEELQRFNRATVGRELNMVELKKQINALSLELEREPPYPLTFLNDDAKRASP